MLTFFDDDAPWLGRRLEAAPWPGGTIRFLDGPPEAEDSELPQRTWEVLTVDAPHVLAIRFDLPGDVFNSQREAWAVFRLRAMSDRRTRLSLSAQGFLPDDRGKSDAQRTRAYFQAKMLELAKRCRGRSDLALASSENRRMPLQSWIGGEWIAEEKVGDEVSRLRLRWEPTAGGAVLGRCWIGDRAGMSPLWIMLCYYDADGAGWRALAIDDRGAHSGAVTAGAEESVSVEWRQTGEANARQVIMLTPSGMDAAELGVTSGSSQLVGVSRRWALQRVPSAPPPFKRARE